MLGVASMVRFLAKKLQHLGWSKTLDAPEIVQNRRWSRLTKHFACPNVPRTVQRVSGRFNRRFTPFLYDLGKDRFKDHAPSHAGGEFKRDRVRGAVG